MRAFTLALLAAALVAFSNPASAREVPGLPEIPADTETCTRDGNGDGVPDPCVGASGGGPCAGYYPVAGAGVDAQAAGQSAHVAAASVLMPLCGVAVEASVTSGHVDALAPIVVDPDAWCHSSPLCTMA